MDGSQSSPVPPPGQRPGLRDFGWIGRYSMRGLFELVRARIAFSTFEAREIPLRNAASRGRATKAAAADPELVARIAYVLPRISARLPWRSDCLIQAIAGQNWLASLGLASEIQIGVRRTESEPFGAHAWLVHANHIISGGDVADYYRLLGEQEYPRRNGPDTN
jgi:hypothetical protein